jgi:hypothetical protein
MSSISPGSRSKQCVNQSLRIRNLVAPDVRFFVRGDLYWEHLRMQLQLFSRNSGQHSVLMAALIGLLTVNSAAAGELSSLFGHGSGCNCNSAPVHYQPSYSMVAPAPAVYMAPMVENACACSAVASACCGVGGGMLPLGDLYGSGSLYGTSANHGYGSPAPGSFLSGYEGLPNMDGGGIHHRYPYHSYRRPWAHPGTPSTNITIVW